MRFPDELGCITVFPDGLAGAPPEKLLSVLAVFEVSVVGAAPFTYTTAMMDAQRAATLAKDVPGGQGPELYAVRVTVETAGPSVILFLACARGERRLQERIFRVKGRALRSSDYARSLRGRLGAPHPLLKFIHVPASPGEITRELPIVLGAEQAQRWMRTLAARSHGSALSHPAICDVLSRAAIGRRRFDLESVLGAVRTAVAAADPAAPAIAELNAGLAALAAGRPVRWADLAPALSSHGGPLDVFDRATLQAHCVRPWPEPAPTDRNKADSR